MFSGPPPSRLRNAKRDVIGAVAGFSLPWSFSFRWGSSCGHIEGEPAAGFAQQLFAHLHESGLRVLVDVEKCSQRSSISECNANGGVGVVDVYMGHFTKLTCDESNLLKLYREPSFACLCPNAMYE